MAEPRSERDGYDVEWVEADVEALPFDDASFDCVGSVFGAMIAPRPRVVAEELFRVVRPGGTVGMTAWTPRGFSAELFRLGRSYAPAQGDQPLSDEWSDEDKVRERFDGLAARFELERAGARLALRLARRDGRHPRHLGTAVGGRASRTCRRIVGSRSWARRASSPGAGRAATVRSRFRTNTR